MQRAANPTALAAAGLAGVTLALAGCGGTSSAGIARLRIGTRAFSASPEAGGQAGQSIGSSNQAIVAFARCMRSNGVPAFPDSGLIARGAGTDPSSPVFQAARAKCQKLIPGGGPPGPGSPTHPPSSQTLARFLGIAQCMRRHGISRFPDPVTSVPPDAFRGSVGEISDIEGVILLFPAAIDQQSREFKLAAAACTFPLHNH